LVALVAVVAVSAQITGIASNGELVQQYIVVLAPNGAFLPFNREARDEFIAARLPSLHAFNHRQEGQHIYNSNGFIGFSAMLTASEFATLSADNMVSYIEEDRVISLDRNMAAEVSDIQVPTWGCDRADQRALPLDNKYKLPITKEEAVAIPNVYVVDTGVYPKHNEFEGRASMAADFIGDGKNADCNGHGTHCAGTVGGLRTGIAPFANLFGVRVLDCGGSGTLSGVSAGIDWVAQNAVKPAVMSMSLGGGYSKALNDATAAAMEAGVTVVVASGNSNADACRYSPASTPGSITVNAMNIKGAKSSFSNYGKCTVIYAPGEDVVSTWYTGPDVYKSLAGTSMATPHIAGAAALILARKPNATHKQVMDALICASTANAISGSRPDTPNRLFYLEKATMEKCLP